MFLEDLIEGVFLSIVVASMGALFTAAVASVIYASGLVVLAYCVLAVGFLIFCGSFALCVYLIRSYLKEKVRVVG
jgi:hypothetical protein